MSNEYLKAKILELIRARTSDNPISSVRIYEQVSQMGLLNGQSKESFRGDFRGFVNEFRQMRIRILADNRGYWLADSDQKGDEEVFKYIKRAKHRWFEIEKGIRGLQKTLPKDAFTGDMFESAKEIL